MNKELQQEIDTVAEESGLMGMDRLVIVVKWPWLASLLRFLFAWAGGNTSTADLLARIKTVLLSLADTIRLQNDWERRARLAHAQEVGRPVDPGYLGFESSEFGTVHTKGDVTLKLGDKPFQWTAHVSSSPDAPGAYATVYLSDQAHLINLLAILGRPFDPAIMDEKSKMPPLKLEEVAK